ncbi:MAG: amidohydrolase family protein [Candidatus Thorarchaeota archaeon]
MLIVRATTDIAEQGIRKGDEFRLYIVDAHHHMGKEKSHRNTPSGSYDFYASLWFEMQKIAKQKLDADSLLFEPVRVEGHDLASRCFESRKSWSRLNHGWLVDRTVVFPYTDDYARSENPAEPTFKVSNDKIAGWTTRAPHSTRLIGFARVDPMDEQKKKGLAVKELDRSIQELGLRGLKLHPLAQLFVDSIEDKITKDIVKRAGELGIPVIFDTRNIATVLKIKNLVESIRNDPECGTAMRGLKVILAHCGMSPGDSRLYEVLRDPAIFAETSTLHDLDVPALFESAVERLGREDFSWSEKILFGTDFSFLSVQAADVILFLLSRDFPGTLADAQRILGGNTLFLVQRPFSTSTGAQISPIEYVCSDVGAKKQTSLENSILKLFSGDQWDLSSLDVMLPPAETWPELVKLSNGGFNGVYLDSYVMCLRNQISNKEIHLWVRRTVGDSVSCSLLSTKGMARIDTIENASQSFNPVLMRTLSNHSITLKSSEDLSKKVLSQLT